MKYVLIVALVITLWTSVAWASCMTYHYILPDGRIVVCTQCCSGAHCTVTCF